MAVANGSSAGNQEAGRAEGRADQEPIAIVGIGCRFPGDADSPDAFWRLLVDGKDAITEVPPDRWDLDSFYDPDPTVPGKMHTRWGGFLKNVDFFDPNFFGISPREAAHIDPQQRLLLQVAWEALEDAGQQADALSGSNTGVFIGISSHDYSDLQIVDPAKDPNKDILSGLYGGTGGVLSIAANRISYSFNLQGPSVAVDTACSSALVATHLACQSIWNGESDMALAGGVNAILSPTITIAFCKAGMLSADGRSKAFDARANGYVRSEGAGVVVLKRLSAAQADGDRIYALVRGSGVNQDGHTQGLTVPSFEAQSALLREVYAKAGIAPDEVDYIEAHGTGTNVGDPIEASAIGTVVGKHRPDGHRLTIGSIKTNIGHAEAASGIAGLIKVALMLKQRQLPPSLHFSEPNPKIAFDEFKLRVPQSVEAWPAKDRPRVAGVNSFGFGGTNAHVILEEAPEVAAPRRAAPAGPYLLPISARSPEALHELARRYLELSGDDAMDLAGVCAAASLRRSHFDYRLAVVAESREDLRDQLQAFLDGETRPRMSSGRQASGQTARLAFVFSGMGPQWWAMGRQLLEREPVFRATIERIDGLLRPYSGWSLVSELTAGEAESRMSETAVAQPANFALQVALCDLWRFWGIKPDAVIGHSTGEVAAACVSGALSLEDAVRVIFHRSRLQQTTAGQGRMLAAGLSEQAALREIEPFGERVTIGAINSSSSVTLSGDEATLEEIARRLEEKGVFARLLSGDVPYHSAFMDPIEQELKAELQVLQPRTASIALYSVVSGGAADGKELGPDYWWKNVRQPVRFLEAVEKMVEDGYTNFLELSPHPVLARDIALTLAGRQAKGAVLPSLRREDDERAVALSSLGALYTLGQPVEWRTLYRHCDASLRLPSYAWQAERYWHEPEAIARIRLGLKVHPLLQRSEEVAHPTWVSEIDLKRLAYLKDHRLLDTVLFPATGFLEMIQAAGREMYGEGPLVVEDVEIRRPLVLLEGAAPLMQLVVEPQDSLVTTYSRSAGSSAAWATHTVGRLRDGRGQARGRLDLEDLRRRCAQRMSGSEVYEGFEARRIQYGPTFRGITTVWKGDAEAVSRIDIPESLLSEFDSYLFHPAVLDACLQPLLTLPSNQAGVHLPVRMDRIRFFGHPDSLELWSYVRMTHEGASQIVADVFVCDPQGNIILEASGARCQFMSGRADGLPEDMEDCLFECRWIPRAGPATRREAPDYLAAPRAAAEVVRPAAARVSAELERDRAYRELDPDLERLCAAYVARALDELGWQARPGDEVRLDSLVEQFGVIAAQRTFFGRMLEILEEDGLLSKSHGDAWLVNQAPPIGDTEALLTDLQRRFSDYAPELNLLGATGPRLAAVLRGESDPLQLIFPEGAMSSAEGVYQESPSFRVFNIIAQKAVQAAIAALPPGRTVRVLEAGAGTGATSFYLLPVLPADRTEYVFTDVSRTFTAYAQKKFRDYPFLRFDLLDLEQDPVSQGFQPHSFDLVVATDVLHATRDLRESLRNIRRLLAPGGQLVLLELTSVRRLTDLVFGLLGGWWRFEDHDLRPNYPLLSQAQWTQLLAEEGFDEVAALDDAGEGVQPLHSVFLARSPDGEPEVESTLINLPQEPGTWLLYADSSGVGLKLAALLDAYGESAVLVTPGGEYSRLSESHFQIRPDDGDDARLALTTVLKEWPALRGAVHLWNLDLGRPTRSPDLLQAEALGSLSVMHLLQALAALEPASPPRLWLASRGAQVVGARDASISLSQAPVWGIGRVIGTEHPQLQATLVDLDPTPSVDEVESLFSELWLNDSEHEVAFRGSSRFVNRLVRVTDRDEEIAPTLTPAVAAERPFRMEVSRPGIVESLVLRETPRREPGPGEVEIEVYAAALNFRDVMKAMGLYPTEDESDCWLGDECAGRIVRVGAGVQEFKAGDEVIALDRGTFSAYLTLPASHIVAKPRRLSFEEAAALPVAFLTAGYALEHLGRMQPGERVLIHAAAGGVGLAAVQLAQRAGAEVFATAGSHAKREYLRSLGVRHVMDDRSFDFVDEIAQATGGRGVDIVLNSLAGEFIPKSLSVLAPLGRFLELGKVDIFRNGRMGLWPFRNALSYFAIDMVSVMNAQEQFTRDFLRRLIERFATGELTPIELTSFPIGEAAKAVRYMQQAKHTGKVVLTLRGQEVVVTPRTERPALFHEDASYLISGGLGGFGLTVAQWMVEQGARHLVLAGRSGAATPEAERAVEQLRDAGANVLVAKADVADENDVDLLLQQARATMPPLRGIFHAAAVLDDGLLTQLDNGRFRRVTAPKALGAWNLHTRSLADPLDYFVLFSSFSPMLGNPGQANYAAANLFLDALAQLRASQGLPALSVNWGALGEVGFLARHEEVNRHLERLGIETFTPAESVALLGAFLRGRRPQIGAIRMDLRQLGAYYAQITPMSRLSFLFQQETLADTGQQARKGEKGWIRSALLSAAPEERQGMLETFLREELAKILGASASRLDFERPLVELGMDSLMAVQLETMLELELGVALPTGFSLGPDASMRKVVAQVLTQMAGSGQAANAARASA